MWEKIHKKSERLASRADLTLKQGLFRAAKSLYSQAASYEAAAFIMFGSRSPRTTGILAVSVASLLSKAGRHEDAVWFTITQLPSTSLPKFARDQLEEIRFLNSGASRKAS